MRVVRQLVLVVSLMFTGSFGMAMAAQDELPVEIIPNDGEYAGYTMAEWDLFVAQQVFSFPYDMNPNNDPSGGELCGMGQFGPVFILPTPMSLTGKPDMEIRCTIPEGLAIYLNFHGAACGSASPDFLETEEEMRACAVEAESGLEDAIITINGIPVDDPMQYHRSTPMGIVQFGPNNAFGVEPAVMYIVGDGHSFIIAPPEPGQYIIDLDNIRDGHPEMGHLRWIIDVVSPTVGRP